MFDIDKFLKIYSAGNLRPYFQKIKEADSKSLKNFKRKVTKHRKKSRKIQAFSNLKNYTVHDLLISAINSELRRRSPFFKVYKGLIPLCRWIVLKTGSKEITFTDESGLPSFCTGLNINFFFAPLKTICFKSCNFLLRYWKWSIGTIISILILIPMWRNNTQYIDRPYVIFDATTIHKDGGAMEYLEEIEVEVTGQTYKNVKPEEVHDYQLEITITPKQYLAHAPLIESLGGLRSMIIYDGKRGTKYQWVYTVLVRPPYGGDIKTQKFRLEILR